LGFIRLQILWERLQPVLGGPLDPTNLGYLKQDIAWAKAAGAQISIDPHNFGRYSINQNGVLSTYIIDNEYNGQVVVSSADLENFWVLMSNEFKDEPAVVAYDLMNEPHDMGTANWSQIAQNVLTAIRNNGDNKLVMIPGDDWSSAEFWATQPGQATAFISDPANNFLYEAHEYFDSDSSGTYAETYDEELAANPNLATVGVTRLQPFVNWCQSNSAPCYLGEYGIPNNGGGGANDTRWNTVLNNFLVALDSAGFSGTYWAAGEWWGTYPLSVQPLNGFTQDRVQTPVLLGHLAPKLLTSVSAAGVYGYAVAPGQLVTGYGTNLAQGSESAPSVPLPTMLQGAQVQLTDINGSVSSAPLLFASPYQLNYQLPSSIPAGLVNVSVLNGGSQVATGVLEVQPIAPTLFTANSSGSGVAAAQILRTSANGTQTYENVATYNSSQSQYVPAPISFGSDSLSLILYGTGFDQPANSTAGSIEVVLPSGLGANLNAQYVGQQPDFPGLDQMNVNLPESLSGAGQVTVTATINGIVANAVTLAFQ
jgi:endoglucanase